jgi:hypothetical protein
VSSAAVWASQSQRNWVRCKRELGGERMTNRRRVLAWWCVLPAGMLASVAPTFARGGGSHGGGSHSSGSHSSGSHSGSRGSGYGTGSNPSSHQTKGYTRKDGTYVQPHYQTNPNGTTRDNYNTRGNYNPHNGKVGTRSPKD